MSEIFYSQVDLNLQQELNARALAGHRRTTDDLNYMLSKVANVRINAYEFNSKDVYAVDVVNELGGRNVTSAQYLPTGPYGYLSPFNISKTELAWIVEGITGKVAVPVLRDTTAVSNNNRWPPYISAADISVGDHSMGLLNTATVTIEVPNVSRDIDLIEEIYMRPGRKVKVDIEYPLNSVITGLTLSEDVLPTEEKLKSLYGTKIDIAAKLQEISKMNRVSFEGLITSFDLSYNSDYSATVTLTMRGTSNVLADVTALTDPDTVKENSDGTATVNPITNPDEYANSVLIPTGSGIKSFYDLLFSEAETLAKGKSRLTSDVTVLTGEHDDWILFGNAFATTGVESKNDQKTYQRYITLNRLIKFINRYVVSKLKNTVAVPEIVCDSEICNSSYYANIVSVNPWDVLLLPSNGRKRSTEAYGTKVFFESTNFGNWPGFLSSDRAFPPRIFLNLSMIKKVIENLEKNSSKSYPISDLLKEISTSIEDATAGAIKMKLISHPRLDSVLLFYDEKYLGQPESLSVVKPYHVPMHAKVKVNEEESYGSIVQDFKMSAKLPDSAATLSYVLNQAPDKVSEDDIAPYMNAMYQFNDPAKLSAAEALYAQTHTKRLQEFEKQKEEYGKSITDRTLQAKLKEAMVKYLQYPYKKFDRAQAAIAPIFPWDVSFTIEGINGFRYGDVLTFDVLPKKYTANTVFSIISITHNVAQDGQWTTEIKCIMRPKLDK
jgi:hypothetical protein